MTDKDRIIVVPDGEYLPKDKIKKMFEDGGEFIIQIGGNKGDNTFNDSICDTEQVLDGFKRQAKGRV